MFYFLKNKGYIYCIYTVHTAVDQQGEQTINRKAKCTGGVKGFVFRSWISDEVCLNRAEQATNTKTLNEICGIGTPAEMYKPLQSAEEQRIAYVISVLTDEYVNPYESNLDRETLANFLSSDVA